MWLTVKRLGRRRSYLWQYDAAHPPLRRTQGGPGRFQKGSNSPQAQHRTLPELRCWCGVTEGTRTPDLRDHNSTRPLPADSSRSL
jgi:hypothetical protein